MVSALEALQKASFAIPGAPGLIGGFRRFIADVDISKKKTPGNTYTFQEKDTVGEFEKTIAEAKGFAWGTGIGGLVVAGAIAFILLKK